MTSRNIKKLIKKRIAFWQEQVNRWDTEVDKHNKHKPLPRRIFIPYSRAITVLNELSHIYKEVSK